MGADENKARPTRRNWEEQLPAHYCVKCTSVTLPEDPSCPHCDAARPDEGWASIQDGFDHWLGRVLDGRYLITRRIGRGAVGAVYLAESLAISRKFAIKVIDFEKTTSGLDADQIRARLHREIEALGRLRNPHVVPLYEVLELFDEFVGVVMDYVEGSTLEDLVAREGALKLRRGLTLLRQIANGVHEAHQAGMIHRDLKPENIMVEQLPAGDDFVHILDFGIVRMDDGVSMTQGFLGTPLYASPEQAMAGDVDLRSDVYSTGAVAYYIFTGRPPFLSENVYEILSAHVRSRVPPMAESAPQRTFPAELESLVSDMLAKSPAQRPDDLAEVIRRVDELLQSPNIDRHDDGLESVEMDPIGARERTGTGEQSPVEETRSFDDAVAEASPQLEEQGGERDGSIFQSSEFDQTGPKAAIFKRNPSRGTVADMLEESRREQEVEPDRIVRSDTGAYSLGVEIEALTIWAGSSDDVLACVTADDELYLVRDGVAEKLYSARREITAVAVGGNAILLGDEVGEVVRVTHDGEVEQLFQDVRRVPITSVGTDDDGRVLLAGSESGRVYMASGDGNEWLRIQDGPPVEASCVSPEGGQFAVARRHKEIQLFNTSAPRTSVARAFETKPATALAISRDRHLLAVVLEDESVSVRMTISGERVTTIRSEQRHIGSVVFDQENKLTGYFEVDGLLYGLDLQRQLAPARSD